MVLSLRRMRVLFIGGSSQLKRFFKRFWQTGVFGGSGSTNCEAMREMPINKGLLDHRRSASWIQKLQRSADFELLISGSQVRALVRPPLQVMARQGPILFSADRRSRDPSRRASAGDGIGSRRQLRACLNSGSRAYSFERSSASTKIGSQDRMWLLSSVVSASVSPARASSISR